MITRQRDGRPVGVLSAFDGAAWIALALYAGFIVALLLVDLLYLKPGHFLELFTSPDLRFAMKLSIVTSAICVLLSLVLAVPVGYALSRFRFPGRTLVDTLVDVPIVLPPLVMGISLLVFFQTPLGRAIEGTGLRFVYAPAGIVLAQFAVTSAYAVRMVKASFDSMDYRLEDVARTLGWSRTQAFLRVTLPTVRTGIVAAAVIAWAHAIGLFGPLMVFTGTTRQKTEVLATSVYLELSVGNVEMALAISMFLVVFAMAALFLVKRLGGGIYQ